MSTPNTTPSSRGSNRLELIESSVTVLKSIAVVLFWGRILAYAVTLSISRAQFGIAFLGGSIVIYMLFEIEALLSDSRVWRALLFSLVCLLTVVITVYMYTEYQSLINIRVGFNTPVDYLLSLALVVIVTALTYREYGLPFVFVIGVTVIYAFFGPYFPSLLQHTGLEGTRILQVGVLNIEGLYGNLTQIMGTWIALFLLFAGLIQGYGAFDLIMRGARKASEIVDSGVAQAAVISSIAIGSVNGSATANTGITGSITIPMMKKNGIKAETAAAVEAVASTGGQIMPPVMGAAAFLMASLLSIPFFDVLVAGIVPALIFYIPVAFAVHFAVIDQIKDSESTTLDIELPEKSRFTIVWQALQFLVPFVVLLVCLGVLQYSIMYSALITNGVMLITGILFPLAQERNIGHLREIAVQTLDGFEQGAQTTAPIAIVIASIGFIVDVLLTTGIPTKISLAILDISGGVFLIAIVLALIISIILGMGMPTSAAYLIVALLVAPSLINNFDIPELAVHFFVFYAAILSALTPPIAVGIVVATGIADADFWKTTVKAFRIGFPAFLLPFLFMYHPEMVSSNITIPRLITGITALLGMIFLAYSVNSSFSTYSRFRASLLRIVYIIAGVSAMFPSGVLLRVGALVVGISAFVSQNSSVLREHYRSVD